MIEEFEDLAGLDVVVATEREEERVVDDEQLPKDGNFDLRCADSPFVSLRSCTGVHHEELGRGQEG